jgi:hypothetical protein
MLNMISRKQRAVIAAALISGTAWMASPAQAAAPLPKEGTVLTMLSPATNGCPALNWVVKVGPNDTLNGTVSEMDRTDVWRVTGSFKADRTFHLVGKELNGAQRTGAVDGYVRDSDGSLIFTVGDISGPSTCNNRSVWVQWYLHGDGYAAIPYGGGGSGG